MFRLQATIIILWIILNEKKIPKCWFFSFSRPNSEIQWLFQAWRSYIKIQGLFQTSRTAWEPCIMWTISVSDIFLSCIFMPWCGKCEPMSCSLSVSAKIQIFHCTFFHLELHPYHTLSIKFLSKILQTFYWTNPNFYWTVPILTGFVCLSWRLTLTRQIACTLSHINVPVQHMQVM